MIENIGCVNAKVEGCANRRRPLWSPAIGKVAGSVGLHDAPHPGSIVCDSDLGARYRCATLIKHRASDGRGITEKLDQLPADVDFVFIVLHHALVWTIL